MSGGLGLRFDWCNSIKYVYIPIEYMEGKIYLEGEINESGGVNDVDTTVPIFSICGG